MSSIVNKVKDALHSDKSHETSEGHAGPHSNKAANAADPRVDSDRDHRANPGYGNTSTTGTHGTTGAHTGTHDPLSSHGTTGNTYSTGTAGSHPEGSHGPHGSKIANAADPRVDSDRDHRANPYDNTSTHGTTGLGGHGGNTYGSSTTSGYGSGTSEGVAGPHGSRAANAVDPRVDSDRDHRGNATHGSSGLGGSTGTYGSSTTGHSATGHNTTGHSTTGHGAAGSHLGNSGPGPAPNTAGPHKSDALNKADPRVDSDLDGSKTYAGDKTYGS